MVVTRAGESCCFTGVAFQFYKMKSPGDLFQSNENKLNTAELYAYNGEFGTFYILFYHKKNDYIFECLFKVIG